MPGSPRCAPLSANPAATAGSLSQRGPSANRATAPLEKFRSNNLGIALEHSDTRVIEAVQASVVEK
jgi:hypothetical protein